MAIPELIIAANGGVPAGELKPHNCHEAALGWVLMGKYASLRNVDPLSHGVEKAWLSVRSLAQRYGANAPKQLTGPWFGQNLYHQGAVRVQPPVTGASFQVGDVVLMGNPQAPHHSMVVVQTSAVVALARGFNNAGAFGGPYMGWDPLLRDLADPTRWDANGNFRGNNGPAELRRIPYATICQTIPDDLDF